MWNGFGYGGCGGVGFIFQALFIGLIILVAVRMVSHGWWMHGDRYGHSALDIAKERYAKGEINKVEYDQIKKDLS